MDADDLAELLGNLLDNATKWAREQVRVSATAGAETVRIEVADDGPGVPEADRGHLGTRGLRLDAETPGHGIGLGIVRDIVTAYGGTLAFGASAEGGLEAAVTLPRAQVSIGQVSRR